MGLKRKYKKYQKCMKSIYVKIFSMREPYQIIIDAEACREAIKRKIDFRESLSSILGGAVKLFTSPCVISELKWGKKGNDQEKETKEMEKEGNYKNKSKFNRDNDDGSHFVAKRCEKLRCKHYPSKSSQDCIFDLIHSTNNQCHYGIVAQNEQLRKNLEENVAGVPILHIYRGLLMMNDPSTKTISAVKEREAKITKPADFEIKMLDKISPMIHAVSGPTYLRKKAKGPNPLSCKKPTVKIDSQSTFPNNDNSNLDNKKSRKRKKHK